MNLSPPSARLSLNGISQTVRHNFFNPNVKLPEWLRLFDEEIQSAAVEDPARFSQGVHLFLQALNSSHVALFHESGAQVPIRYALHATIAEFQSEHGPAWVFLDVLGGGLADKAGIVPGDAILAVNGATMAPPVQPTFALGGRRR
ncbi:MAG: hypothetical protein IPJ98_00680 [Bryobacterales bacterium]|nr:hypothetical protein [Bryobacterales bacterium]